MNQDSSARIQPGRATNSAHVLRIIEDGYTAYAWSGYKSEPPKCPVCNSVINLTFSDCMELFEEEVYFEVSGLEVFSDGHDQSSYIYCPCCHKSIPVEGDEAIYVKS